MQVGNAKQLVQRLYFLMNHVDLDGRILACTLAALMPSRPFSVISCKLPDTRWRLASDIPVVVLSFERSGGLESQRSKWEGMVLCGAAGGA